MPDLLTVWLIDSRSSAVADWEDHVMF